MKNTPVSVIGFVGTGTITTALVTGFCERDRDNGPQFVLSPRSVDRAQALKEKYPDRVYVAGSNQEVLDRSDWVVLAVLPEQGEAVCKALQFRSDHKVINLLCDKTLEEVRSWIGETAVLLHAVPSTFHAFFDGPVVICPPNEEAAELLGKIGTVIQVDSRHQAAILQGITACMISVFTVMDRLAQWASEEGVPREDAVDFVTNFFLAISQEAIHADSAQLHQMAEVSTSGGVNYLVKSMIQQKDGFSAWTEGVSQAAKRLAGGSGK